MKLLALALLSALPAVGKDKQDSTLLVHNGTPFELHVTKVVAAPEEKVGFGKSLEVYLVDAYSTVSVGSWHSGPQRFYTLYCVKAVPEVGKVYAADDEYIDGRYSVSHSWPMEKSALGLHEKGRLYRIVQIHDMFSGEHSDLGCDVHSAEDLNNEAK